MGWVVVVVGWYRSFGMESRRLCKRGHAYFNDSSLFPSWVLSVIITTSSYFFGMKIEWFVCFAGLHFMENCTENGLEWVQGICTVYSTRNRAD